MDKRVDIALEIMHHSSAEALTVADVAARVGLSSSRFEHILKDGTGRTFRQHKRSGRIERAKVLLQNWRLSLKEIAYLIGYSSRKVCPSQVCQFKGSFHIW